MCTLSILKKELSAQANPEKAKILQQFFKTGAGEYGEGDVFLGVAVPDVRKIAKKYNELALLDVVDLSAYKIVGEYLSGKPKAILYQLARSKILWERRIAIVATFSFIKKQSV